MYRRMYPRMGLMDRHTEFQDRLARSHDAGVCVADYLSRRGRSVTISGLSIAPTVSESSHYVDSGDLFLHKRVEVKQIQRPFSCVDDYPYEDILVCSVASFDRARDKPYLYFVVDVTMTHAGVIVVDQTRQSWTTRSIKDSRRGTSQLTYTCPKSLAQFITIKE